MVHPDEDAALLEVDVVAEGPEGRAERRVGPEPGPVGRGRDDAGRAVARALGLVEAADGVVAVGRVEGVVRGPAVVEALGPDAGDAQLGQLVDLAVGQEVPLVDGDGVEPGVVGAGARRDVEVGDGLVEVVHDEGVEVEEDLHDVLAQLEGQAEVVAVVVVRDVLAPVEEPVGDVGLGVLALGHGHVDLLVAAVGLEDGGDERDGVLADGLDEGRLVDGDAVGELHEHLDGARLAGVEAAGGPVDRLGLGEEGLGFGVRELAGIGQAGVDRLVFVEVADGLSRRRRRRRSSRGPPRSCRCRRP